MNEIVQTKELIEAHKKRLHQLQIQEAQDGYSVDPKVTTEIKEIQDKLKKLNTKLEATSPFQNIALSETLEDLQLEDDIEDEEERGLIDLIEDLENDIELVTDIFEQLTVNNSVFEKKLCEQAERIVEVNQISDNKSKLKAAKSVSRKIAKTLNAFSTNIESNNSTFRDAFVRMSKSLIHLAVISDDFKYSKSEMKALLIVLPKFRESIERASNAVKEVSIMINSTPRIVRDLNRAKKRGLLSLGEFENTLEEAINLLFNAEKAIRQKIT